MKVKLLLQDIIKKAGINPSEVKLLRHKSDIVYDCKKKDMIKDFTAVQRTGFSNNYKYWMVFISGNGTTAIFDSFYEVHGSQPVSPDLMPKGFPVPERYGYEGHDFFDLERKDYFEVFENRLVIEWGKSPRWDHNGETEKVVKSIQAIKKYEFPGYENIILSYSELEEIIKEPLLYEEWHIALESVYGIYLITDKKEGKHYVGSASGNKKILQRWTDYVNSGHGGNQGLIEIIDNDRNRCRYFQFSILQIFSPSSTREEILDAENNFKKKLCSKNFGLNEN